MRNKYRRNPFFQLKTFCEGEGGATGGTDENAGGAASGGQQQGKNTEQNNLIDDGSLWDTVTNEQQNMQQQGGGSEQQQGHQQSAEEQFAAHVESLNLGSGIDAAKIAHDLQQGDTESFSAGLQTIAQSAYRAAMIDANRLMENKIAAAVDSAITKAGGNFKSDLALRDLNDALPFTKDKAVAPIAKAVFTQFVQKGKTQAEAIKLTGEFFKHTAKVSGKDLSADTPPRNKPGQRGFSNMNKSTQNEQDDSDEIDFFALLGVPQQ